MIQNLVKAKSSSSYAASSFDSSIHIKNTHSLAFRKYMVGELFFLFFYSLLFRVNNHHHHHHHLNASLNLIRKFSFFSSSSNFKFFITQTMMKCVNREFSFMCHSHSHIDLMNEFRWMNELLKKKFVNTNIDCVCVYVLLYVYTSKHLKFKQLHFALIKFYHYSQ